MPVILNPSDYGRWVDPGDPERPPLDILRPFVADFMKAWEVGSGVGNVKNDRPDLCEPLT
jgi:putative SOS response-associated peptidase YedK